MEGEEQEARLNNSVFWTLTPSLCAPRSQNHTMLRVKDAEKSLKFYQDVLGMTLFRKNENPSAGFTLFFLGYPGEQGGPSESEGTAKREGLLELTWNHGTEKDESFAYHNGNDQPQGFGHIGKLFSRLLPLS